MNTVVIEQRRSSLKDCHSKVINSLLSKTFVLSFILDTKKHYDSFSVILTSHDSWSLVYKNFNS